MNSTSNSSLIVYQSVKDRALYLLKEEKVNEKEILSCSQDLLAIPNLNENIVPESSQLFKKDSFEICSKKKVNPIFIRNLLNIIQIINFIWIATKNNADLFHRILLNLGMQFSYLFRNEKDINDGVDYALLAPIPSIIYDFIAKNGKDSFKSPNDFFFDEEIFSTEKSDTQIGYVYQEASISKILSNLNPEKIIICPKIMYYLEYNFSKELFNKKLFNSPENYLNLAHYKKEYNGYNEIDMSFSLSETIKLKENFTFNIVKKKNDDFISKTYLPNESSDIVFESDTNIFIELKSSIKKSKVEELPSKLKNMAQRFSVGYKNTAYTNLDKKYSKHNIRYFLLYDENRIELFNQALKNIKIDQDVEVCYNSINAPLSSIVSLQNQIRETKKEVSSLREQIIKDKYDNDFKFSIMNIKIFNIKEDIVRKRIDKCIEERSMEPFNIFKRYNDLFFESSKALKKIIPTDDIINLNDAIIGKDEIDPNYPYLIMKLDNKIKDGTFAKDYYTAYRNALTGKSYLESNKQKLDYPDCSNEISEMLKNILSFICLLDLDPLLLNSFYAAILYYTVTISKSDKVYTALFYSNFNNSDIKKCIIYLIQSIIEFK